MKTETVLLWLLIAALVLAMVLTVVYAPRRSLHGYGFLFPSGKTSTAGRLQAWLVLSPECHYFPAC